MIATKKRDSKWITGQKTREFSNKRRANQQAILVGSNTVILDDPLLNVRYKNYASPIVVILDNKGNLNSKLNVFKKNQSRKIIFTNKNYVEKEFENTEFINLKKSVIPTIDILKILFKMQIKSILIEGGSYTFNEFLKDGRIDSLEIYMAPKITGDIDSIHGFNFQKINKINKTLNLAIKEIKKIDKDIFIKMEKKCLQEL